MVNKYTSFLFVPATEKLLKKIEKCNADAVIVDLEDAILPDKKVQALKRLKDFLEGYSFSVDIFVRINPDRMAEETKALNDFKIKGFMLPKAETSENVERLSKFCEDKQIIALIESAMGIVNAEEIITNKKVDIVAFGAEDYTMQCSIENRSEYLIYPKSKLVILSKAYGKTIIDTISLNINNKETFELEVKDSKSLGFDGKLAIHPMQVEVINRVFDDDVDYYKQIIAEYEKNGEAVLNINGKVFEKPHIDAMRRKIESVNHA